MDIIKTNDLIYYTGTKEKYIDFSGEESSLPVDMRHDFLKHYAEAACRWYNDETLDKKAYTQEEIQEFMPTLSKTCHTKIRKVLNFDTMSAQTAYKEPKFKNLHLYCGTYYENGEIVFKKRMTRPTPCAKIDINNPKESLFFSAKIYIPSNFKCTQDKNVGTAQPGRIIELRNKTLDVIKIKFFNTGEIFALCEDKWKPVFLPVGKIVFDDWNILEINVDKDVSLTINGETFKNIKRTCNGIIDNIFFDGGMFPYGSWKVSDICIDGSSVIFQKNPKAEESFSEVEEVKLPYAIGGYENRDCRLYLTQIFDAGDFNEAILKIETLDPCGEIWLNNKLILSVDDFMSREITVTNLLKKERNILKILVEPRPPEVYYYWHRHNDCYNGWFCGGITLELTEKIHIDDLKVITKKISDNVKACATVTLNENTHGKISLYATKIYPDTENEFLIAEKEITGKTTEIDFEGNFELWNSENPSLYGIRAVLTDENETETDDFSIETGFRTICQKNGSIYLNNEKVLLNGALTMQFLPPFDRVCINHNCASDEEIAIQAIMIKNMNGNLLRLHILGYGTNDIRYARICDRLGIMLIWTTRLIDSAETLIWEGEWTEKEMWKEQIKKVMNYPSIIMYEGSNEFQSFDLETIDRIYDEFTDMADSVDSSRLLSPCSHLYYGGGIYDLGCKYYNDNGTKDEKGNPACSGNGWTHPNVIRSCHPYVLLGGYGQSWEAMRKQDWKWQQELFESSSHAYMATEYAVTALPNPNTPEARENTYYESYERPDELPPMERIFTREEWKESQALQAIYAFNGTKKLRMCGIDGMNWCCLSSGANNGSYMKPPIDFYGYKKLGFYALASAFSKNFAAKTDLNISYGTEDMLTPVILHENGGGTYSLNIKITDESGTLITEKNYTSIKTLRNENSTKLTPLKPQWKKPGYYEISYELKEEK